LKKKSKIEEGRNPPVFLANAYLPKNDIQDREGRVDTLLELSLILFKHKKLRYQGKPGE
jgi:hypothetical protein